jgi:hypothetical protein
MTEQADAMDLFWYGVRIVGLVAVIIAFMMISLRRFLTQRIILPLEQIDLANRRLQQEIESFHPVLLPGNTPREIQCIVWSREEMLKKILNVSHERLNLIGFIRKTFGKYLSTKVVDEILEYSVSAIAGSYDVALDVAPSPGQALVIRLPFHYWQIHGKKVNDVPLTGHTLSITETRMKVILLPEPALFTDLKLRFQFCR